MLRNIYKNTYFAEYLWTGSSVIMKVPNNLSIVNFCLLLILVNFPHIAAKNNLLCIVVNTEWLYVFKVC